MQDLVKQTQFSLYHIKHLIKKQIESLAMNPHWSYQYCSKYDFICVCVFSVSQGLCNTHPYIFDMGAKSYCFLKGGNDSTSFRRDF